jgi:hypothetical protein
MFYRNVAESPWSLAVVTHDIWQGGWVKGYFVGSGEQEKVSIDSLVQ